MKSPNERDLLLGMTLKNEAVEHPDHYGGKDNPYEVIKVIEAWDLGFHLSSVLKYIGRPAKGKYLEDLKKARWFLDRKIKLEEAEDSEGHRGVEPPESKPSDFKTVRFKVLKPVRSFTDDYPEYFDYQTVADTTWPISKLCEIAAAQFCLNTVRPYGISLAPESGFLKHDETVFWALNMWPQPAYNYYLRERDV
jgi:hypothetical protein